MALDWRYIKQQIGITVLFALIELLLVQNMEAGTNLWQLMTMTAIVWLCVSAVLYSDLLQRRQQHQMDNKSLLLDVISSSSPVMVWSIDSHGQIADIRGRAQKNVSDASQAVIGTDARQVFKSSPGLLRDIDRAKKGGKFMSYQPINGRFFRHHFQSHQSNGGGVDMIHCVSVDLTREKELEEQLRLSSKIFSFTADAIVVTDNRRVIESVNNSFTEITGFSAEDVLGEKLGLPRTASQDVGFYKKVWRDLKKRGVWRGEVWSKRKSGELFSGRMTLKTVYDADGEVSNYVAFFSDVTDLKRSQEELRYLANHDSLTGLPNRRLFLDRLDQGIKRARRVKDRLAVYFIDLDEFKQINDTLGHHVGDSLLKEVGERLRGIVREADTVSRLAGDEFTIIAENVGGNDEVRALAKKILGIFELPFNLHDKEFYVSASVGIGVFPDDGEDLITLMKGADAAMYKAKAEGRNGYYYLSAKQANKENSDLFFNSELRMAIPRNQLSLVYQPQVLIHTGEVIGCEALMRWNHHSRGQVMPNTFIPLAEQAGLIRELGNWALESACQRMSKWRDQGAPIQFMSVNVSLTQMQDPKFPKMVEQALEKSGLPAECLMLDISEKSILVDLDHSKQFIQQLADIGVAVSIDDFGTGKAPYGYLKELPVSVIKVDRKLLNDIKIGKQNDSLLRAIIGLGDVLGVDVVAEGVERSIQEKYLHGVGCRFAQGFLYGKPMSAETFSQQMGSNSHTIQ